MTQISDAERSSGAIPESSAVTQANGTGPLAGLLVADFSRILAGPYATMLLADLGAEVIKVESPAGDDTRTWAPPVAGDKSTYYLSVNRNKRSLSLDLKVERDAATARNLAARADIILENFRPGGLKRFRLDYESVALGNPGVVYASISGFGTGAGASIPGYDLMVQGMSGLMSLTGEADGPPFRAGISVFDVMTGMHAIIGILAALREKSISGQGQHVEVNLLSSALSGLVNQSGAFTAAGVVPHRMGNAHPSLFPYEPLRVADGELIVIAGNDGQFVKLCSVLGVPGLAEDPRFTDNRSRTANREALRPLLEEQLGRRTKSEWFDALIAVGVPCGPINSIKQGVELAESLGLTPTVATGDGDRRVRSVRNPIEFSRSSIRYDLPPPEVGEHNAELQQWLRSDDDR
jgi:crotonobetainyl-CoA:carnitine CoA-transferase CaiB-like acyl-CoA transferase